MFPKKYGKTIDVIRSRRLPTWLWHSAIGFHHISSVMLPAPPGFNTRAGGRAAATADCLNKPAVGFPSKGTRGARPGCLDISCPTRNTKRQLWTTLTPYSLERFDTNPSIKTLSKKAPSKAPKRPQRSEGGTTGQQTHLQTQLPGSGRLVCDHLSKCARTSPNRRRSKRGGRCLWNGQA